ncbi:hypothetical protein Hanom_Chr16g01429501 [Helianthus anomalus]
MKLSYHTVKEAFETLKSQEKVLNQYIDELAEVKRELAEKEKKVNKLQSYHASSYILERIFNITLDDHDFDKNKKGIGSEYHQVPPPLENNYTFYDDEKVEKAVVGKLVKSVLKKDSTEIDKSESHDEDEESFHKKYLNNSKSKKNVNNDSTGLAYYMIGSDKLFLDIEFPIQNVNADKVDKVFKLIEIEKAEIDKFAGKASKRTFYNKPSYKKKNTKAGLVYKKK